MIADGLGHALLFCAAFAAALIVIEILSRKININPSVTRRLAHVASGLFSLYMWHEFPANIFIACNIALLLFISVSHYKHLLVSIHDVKRRTYGEIFLPIGILCAYLLVADKPQVFIASILILTLADACAGIMGDIRQKQRASKLGSLAFFTITFFILLLSGAPIGTVLAIAFITTVVEKISHFGTDNLTVPVAASVLLLL